MYHAKRRGEEEQEEQEEYEEGDDDDDLVEQKGVKEQKNDKVRHCHAKVERMPYFAPFE